MFTRFSLISIILAVFAFAASAVVQAADYKDQLAGKNVKLIIAGSAGGSHDAYGRTLIKHLGLILPDTSFAAQNNRKAGGLLAAKAIQEARGDTITIGLFHPSLVYMQLLNQQEGAFDLSTFKWIASLSHDQRFYGVRRDFPDATLNGAQRYNKQILSGTSSAGARSDIDLLLASALVGLNTKIVYGFRSSAQRKAIIAGELDMVVSSIASNRKLLASGDLIPILKMSPEPYPEAFKGIPSIREVAVPGAPGELVGLLEAINETGRLLTASPSTADADIVALRQAIEKVFQSTDYRQENTKLGLFIQTSDGATVEKRIMSLISENSGLKAKLAKAVDCGKRISEGAIGGCDFASW